MTGTQITFTVHGRPATAGSKRGFPIRRKDGSIGVAMTHDNGRAKNWMGAVAQRAREVYQADLLSGPLELEVKFYLARPKAHFRTGRHATPAARLSPHSPPSETSHHQTAARRRGSLKGVLWHDDSQIVIQKVSKHWTTQSERAEICVRTI